MIFRKNLKQSESKTPADGVNAFQIIYMINRNVIAKSMPFHLDCLLIFTFFNLFEFDYIVAIEL